MTLGEGVTLSEGVCEGVTLNEGVSEGVSNYE